MSHKLPPFRLVPGAIALAAAVLFTAISMGLSISGRFDSEAFAVEAIAFAMAAGLVAVSTVVGWQLVTRWKATRGWDAHLTTVFYLAITVPIPFLGTAMTNAATHYSNKFLDGSIWNGCSGMGLGLLLMVLYLWVLIADIAFAVYTYSHSDETRV